MRVRISRGVLGWPDRTSHVGPPTCAADVMAAMWSSEGHVRKGVRVRLSGRAQGFNAGLANLRRTLGMQSS